MKTNGSLLFMVSLLAMAIAVSSCKKDNYEKLSAADQEAFDGMEAAYLSAEENDDKLKACDDAPATCTPQYLQYCDSLYHHYEYEWNYQHERYNHDEGHCDHSHATNGEQKQTAKQKRQKHEAEEGHHLYHHEKMEQLQARHTLHHPES